MKHYSVLRNELIDALNIKSNGIYVDSGKLWEKVGDKYVVG